jgi:hypothetical protein
VGVRKQTKWETRLAPLSAIGTDPRWRETVTTNDGHTLTIRGTTEEARGDLLSLGDRPSDQDIGQWAQRWYAKPFLVDGTGAGMYLLVCLGKAAGETARDAISRDECCGNYARDDGTCYLAPELICPLVRMAGRIVRQESDE